MTDEDRYKIRHMLEFGRGGEEFEQYVVYFIFAECWGWTPDVVNSMKAKDVEIMLEIARWKIEKERREVEKNGKI